MDEKHGRGEVIKHVPHCLCGAKGVRSDRFDAYFCPTSRVWLEKQCSDATCRSCAKRPAIAPETAA